MLTITWPCKGQRIRVHAEPLKESVGHCGAVKGETVEPWHTPIYSCKWEDEAEKAEWRRCQNRKARKHYSKTFFSPFQEEEMFRLDIYCKTQKALKLMSDSGHFCFFPISSLSSSQKEAIVCVCFRVCVQLRSLLYTRSHYCSLSRPGLIVSHLTASQLCTKLAACCWKRLQRQRRTLKDRSKNRKFKK